MSSANVQGNGDAASDAGSESSSDTKGDAARETTPPVANLEDVTASYGGPPVLGSVSLTIPAGEFLGLLGPNGSGKSTLISILLGLQEPDSGHAELFGKPAAEASDGRVGYVEQRVNQSVGEIPVTVRELVRTARYANAGFRPMDADDHDAIDAALDRVDIADLSDVRVDRLSGGQRQRAFIARALAAEAELLVLDEPAVGVDAGARDHFYDLLRELNDDGITIVLVEHDLGVVTEYATRVACLNRELHFHGKPAALCECDALERTYGSAVRPVSHDHQ